MALKDRLKKLIKTNTQKGYSGIKNYIREQRAQQEKEKKAYKNAYKKQRLKEASHKGKRAAKNKSGLGGFLAQHNKHIMQGVNNPLDNSLNLWGTAPKKKKKKKKRNNTITTNINRRGQMSLVGLIMVVILLFAFMAVLPFINTSITGITGNLTDPSAQFIVANFPLFLVLGILMTLFFMVAPQRQY